MTTPQQVNELAMEYATVFLGTDTGKRVLADLLKKFPPNAASFDLARPEPLSAAIKDGQKSVTREIEDAVRLGANLAGITYTT